MHLSSTIKSIQDIMRKDDGVDGDAQRLGQLIWMLFLKVFDQREEEWEDDNPKYKSPLPEAMRWRNWAAYVAGPDGKNPQIADSTIISFINNELFPTLKELDANASPQHKVIRSVFEDANNYMKSGIQLLAVIEKLEEVINFHDFKTRASLGDVYEQLLNDLRGAGNAGEFYTPRAITQFMADRLNPSLAKREPVMDPACGTGGFLTAAIDHLRNQLTAKPSAADKAVIEGLIRGIEKKQLPHLLCTTNMLLHGIDVPSQIEHRNTLGVGWNEWGANDKVDCVITNPPFGGYEDDGVGGDYPADLRTRETADMFMALIVKKLLKENGRAAVVLPDGFLFGEGDEVPHFLDPTNAHDVTLLAFDEEGKALPAPGVSRWDYVRVRRTVDRLKLTEHQILAEERRKVWQKTAKLLDKYQSALAKAATSAAARQEVKAAACEITSLTKPESELSAVAKWCIRFSNQPCLQRLIA